MHISSTFVTLLYYIPLCRLGIIRCYWDHRLLFTITGGLACCFTEKLVTQSEMLVTNKKKTK